MVRDAENPSLREASCCSVEVVNGAAGLRFAGFGSHAVDLEAGTFQHGLDRGCFRFVVDVETADFLAVEPVTPAWNMSPVGVFMLAKIDQYSCG